MKNLLDIFKSISNLGKTIIGFIVALIADIIFIQTYFQLAVVLTILIIIFAAFIVACYISFAKDFSDPILTISKYPTKTKRFAWIGFLIISLLVVLLIPIVVIKPKPTFEIHFIGLPYKGDDAYYLSDAMIRTQGDLSPYDNYSLKPIQVEIIPVYSGNEKFANVALRLLGNKNPKDIKLWDEFDKDAKPTTISLELKDIIVLSGIQENKAEIETNLKLKNKPYQQAKLELQILPLADTGSIWGAKTLTIKSTPWIQTARIVSRDGVKIDYALENLGPETKFHCKVAIARAKSDVDSSDHDFWSGITDTREIGCDSFSLKLGETHEDSIPINRDTIGHDLPHGRYIVQIYTFAERGDLIFNNGFNYDSSSQTWFFANTGNILTFVICNDPDKSCTQTDTLPIEEKIIKTYAFNSWDEFGNGETYFLVKTYPVKNHSTNQYILNYWIDPQKTGWVGFGIQFETPADMSEYRSLQFKLTLDKSTHPLSLDVKCKVGDSGKTFRVGIGDGKYGMAIAEEQTIVIPFSAFEGIDWSQVDNLSFTIDNYQVPTADEHEIQVSEIEFIH